MDHGKELKLYLWKMLYSGTIHNYNNDSLKEFGYLKMKVDVLNYGEVI